MFMQILLHLLTCPFWGMGRREVREDEILNSGNDFTIYPKGPQAYSTPSELSGLPWWLR